MRRTSVVTMVCGCALLLLGAGAADPKDQLTGLPLHPGLTFQQEQDSPVCGKKAQINIYNAPFDAKLADYVAWCTSELKGFHHVHKVWSERPQEMFYSPDGSRGVSITGGKGTPRVFAVSYMKMSASLTTRQMDAFAPDNPSCK